MNDSRTNEIYLQRFPPDGTKVQVSAAGGISARWTGDSRTLFSVRRDGNLVSVSHEYSSSGVEIGPVRVYARTQSSDYAILPDGSEVFVSRSLITSSEPIVVVTNWMR